MDLLKQFLDKAKKIKMRPEEKARVLNTLSVIIKEDVRKAGLYRHLLQRSYFNVFQFLRLKTMPIIAIVAIISLLGGGVSAAAEATVPGDLFYPVKIGVNEAIRDIVASLSAETEVNWEARKAERRLEEAEELASKGRLDEGKRVDLEARFGQHAEKVKERVAKFESRQEFKAAADVTSNFETSLRAHERILEKLAEALPEGSEVEAKLVVKKVRGEKEALVKIRIKVESEVEDEKGPAVQKAAEGKLKAAENKIAEVHKFLERFATSTPVATTTVQAQARLKIAGETVIEGKAKMAASAYGEAFRLFQKAHRIAQEAKLLLEAQKDFDLEIKINGDLAEDDEDENGVDEDDDEDLDDEDEDTDEGENKRHGSGAEIRGEVKTESKSDSDKTSGSVKIKLEL